MRPSPPKSTHISAPYTLLLMALVLASPSYSDTMRCKTRLVTLGDSLNEVQAKCGPPFFKDDAPVFLRHDPKTPRPPIEILWVYQQGKGRFSKILTFRNERLIRIENGQRQ